MLYQLGLQRQSEQVNFSVLIGDEQVDFNGVLSLISVEKCGVQNQPPRDWLMFFVVNSRIIPYLNWPQDALELRQIIIITQN